HSYGSELRSECRSSFESGRALLETMGSNIADVHEWESYVAARAVLVDAGWGPTIEACESARTTAARVGDTIERAILSRWIDDVAESDERLDPKRSVDRDDLLARFRLLDAELVADAAANVINACAERRPRSLAG